MKIIDLLNRIVNKEELPKKIKVLSNNEIFTYKKELDDYIGENGDGLFNECILNTTSLEIYLNDEVEIIEEDKDIKQIEKSYPIFNFDVKSFEAMKDMLQDVYSKQCELIDAVNELKK